MSKYYGAVGFSESVTDPENPYVKLQTIIELNYAGDVTRNTRRISQMQDGINDEVNISNDISIVVDPYAYQNFHKIKYVTYMGTKWKVNNVEVAFPRLVLHVGGIYTEEEVDEQNG